jgi:hypothetical protein
MPLGQPMGFMGGMGALTPEQERLRQLQLMVQQQSLGGMNQNPGGLNTEALRANTPIPNPAGVGSAYDRAGLGMTNLMNKAGGALFPIDPQAAQNMSAEQMQGMRSNALMQMGLGMMGNARQGLGPALASGYFGARESQLGDQRTSFAFSQANRGEQREIDQLAERNRDDERNYAANRDDEMWMRNYRTRELDEYKLGRIAAMNAGKESMRYDEDDPTLDMAAEDFLRDKNSMRNYASWGAAGTPARKQIAQRAEKLLRDKYNMTPAQLESARANVKAQSRSVARMTQSVNSLQAFDTVVKNNGRRAMQILSKVSDTGIPIVNAITRGAEYNLGSADVAELRQVLQNFGAETARIVAGHPELLGSTTDTAREEINSIVNGNMTIAQAKRVIERLQFEVDLRLSGFQQSLMESSNSMQGLGMPGQQFPRQGIMNDGLGQPSNQFQTAPGPGMPNGMTVQPGWSIERDD